MWTSRLLLAVGAAVCVATTALAQSSAPSTAEFTPEQSPTPAAPTPPAPTPPGPTPPAPIPAVESSPPPAPSRPLPAAARPTTPAAPPEYGEQSPASGRAAYDDRPPATTYYEPPPPPPPPQKPDQGFTLPTLSIRVDPLNWLLDGRLGLELESELWKFISVEVVPVFVTSESPPSLRQPFDTNVTQHSNGIGSLSGASLGVGFWLNGKPMRGSVLRAIITNYGYTYESTDAGARVDQVSHTDRHFYGYLGSHTVWGVFTVAGGFGLGVELNKERRCFEANDPSRPSTDCPNDKLLLAMNRGATQTRSFDVADLHSWTYPIELMFRFSLGVTF